MSKISTAIAGEYHVLSQLLRRGRIAALAPDGAPNMDILVTDENSNKLFTIQVKTKRSGDWKLDRKHEEIISDNLFYVFVDIGKNTAGPTKSYIVPSKVVATCIKSCHQAWLKSPSKRKKRGGTRNDNKDRRLKMDYSYVNPITKKDKAIISNYLAGWLNVYCENWESLPH